MRLLAVIGIKGGVNDLRIGRDSVRCVDRRIRRERRELETYRCKSSKDRVVCKLTSVLWTHRVGGNNCERLRSRAYARIGAILGASHDAFINTDISSSRSNLRVELFFLSFFLRSIAIGGRGSRKAERRKKIIASKMFWIRGSGAVVTDELGLGFCRARAHACRF
jgi:hypothetical protein